MHRVKVSTCGLSDWVCRSALPVLGEMCPHNADPVTLSNNPRAFASFSLTHAEHFVAIYVATRFLSFSFQAIDLHFSDEKICQNWKQNKKSVLPQSSGKLPESPRVTRLTQITRCLSPVLESHTDVSSYQFVILCRTNARCADRHRHTALTDHREEWEKKRPKQWPCCRGLAPYREGAPPADLGPGVCWTAGERDGQRHATEHGHTQARHQGMAKEKLF